jgi:23S rRNA (guanosine2251-2'-O)-methyltransferase
MPERRYVGGLNSVKAALQQPDQVEELWLDHRRRDRRAQEIAALAKAAGIPVQRLARDDLDRLAPGINHQGALLATRGIVTYSEKDLQRLLAEADNPLLLILDGVTDPHNLGACLRTANAAGAIAVIAPRDKSASLTAIAIKVASGAAETTPYIQVTNLARTLRTLQQAGIWIVGTAGEADRVLYEMDLSGPLAMVLGSEGSGLRRLTREGCDHLVRLPMDGQVESLNVSVACGVCLYEVIRQRMAASC